jgi:hypothetical protein
MKCLSFKHSGSKTKILPLSDTRVCIGPKLQSRQLLLVGWAPMSPPNHWAPHWATPTCHSCHKTMASLHIFENTQAKPEQLKLSKTDSST